MALALVEGGAAGAGVVDATDAAVARRALSIGASVMSVCPRPVGPQPRVNGKVKYIDDQVD